MTFTCSFYNFSFWNCLPTTRARCQARVTFPQSHSGRRRPRPPKMKVISMDSITPPPPPRPSQRQQLPDSESGIHVEHPKAIPGTPLAELYLFHEFPHLHTALHPSSTLPYHICTSLVGCCLQCWSSQSDFKGIAICGQLCETNAHT